MTAGTTLAGALETLLDAWLRQDTANLTHLSELSGRVIELRARSPEFSLFFFPDARGVAVQSHFEGEPDAVISGTLANLLTSIGAKTEDRLFTGTLSIQGDTDAAQRFQAALAGVEFDWEEQLSRVTGDVVAHQVGNLLRDFGRALRHGRETLRDDVGEYLQEEARILPTRVEAERFMQDVDSLRADVDRMAARLDRLRRDDGSPG